MNNLLRTITPAAKCLFENFILTCDLLGADVSIQHNDYYNSNYNNILIINFIVIYSYNNYYNYYINCYINIILNSYLLI